jgi:hypothetical protein
MPVFVFSRSLNDTSRVVRMTIVDDATTWSDISDDSRGVIYDHNIFIIQATGLTFAENVWNTT